MASLADCLEGVLHTVTGPGMGVYWQPGGTPDAIDTHLRTVTPALTTAGKVTVFVRADQVAGGIDPALRTHLHRDARLHTDLQIKVVDDEGNPVADPAIERAVANALDLPVTSNQWADDRVAIDAQGQVAPDGTSYLVLPDVMNAQRRAAVDALGGNFSSVADFMNASSRYAGQLGAPDGAGPHTAFHALGAAITTIRANGAAVPPALADLARQPMITPARLVDAAGGPGGLQRARPDGLQSHLLRNPGDFALMVTGDQVHLLGPAPDGGLQWAPPGGNTPAEFQVDGAADRFTEMLEQPGTQVLVLTGDGQIRETVPLDEVPPAPPAVINPPTGTQVGPQGETQIGSWPAQTMSRLGLDTVNLRGVPAITVDARFTDESRDRAGVKDLDPRQEATLRTAGFRNHVEDNRPIVLSTADTPQIREAARLARGVAAFPTKVANGLDVRSSWSMHVPGSDDLVDLGEGQHLTQAMVDRMIATLDAMPALNNDVPPVLVDLLAANSYEEARTQWETHFDELRAPTVGETINRLAGAAPAADPWLSVMQLAHTIAQRTESFRNGPQPIEPVARTSMDTEPALPPGVTPDLQFVFDFLTGRELPSVTPGFDTPGPYQTRLLWDGLLFRMMLGRQLTADEVMVLTNGVNKDDYNRATRDPAAFDASESHAAIFAAIRTLEENGLAMLRDNADGLRNVTIDWAALNAQLAKCRNGEDRVPWHFRIKDILQPHLADQGLLELSAPALAQLRNLIYLCH